MSAKKFTLYPQTLHIACLIRSVFISIRLVSFRFCLIVKVEAQVLLHEKFGYCANAINRIYLEIKCFAWNLWSYWYKICDKIASLTDKELSTCNHIPIRHTSTVLSGCDGSLSQSIARILIYFIFFSYGTFFFRLSSWKYLSFNNLYWLIFFFSRWIR